MRPAVLILECRQEVAAALQGAVEYARCRPIVRTYLECLSDLGVAPAAIIVRIAHEGVSEPPHAVLERLPANRPPVVAIVSADDQIAEATRLRCDVVLRAPNELRGLCDALARVVGAAGIST
jgi:hypothetical protein